MTTPAPALTTAVPANNSSEDDNTIYKLTFYTPPEHTDAILAAIHATGAGTWPNNPPVASSSSASPPPQSQPTSTSVSSQSPSSTSGAKYIDTAYVSRGTGRFRPTAHADPFIGNVGQVTFVDEDRVEMVVVGTAVVKRAVKALRDAHPYEVVALFVVKCEDF